MKLVFLFPTNYKHGQPSNSCYKEIVNILTISPRTQEFLNKRFSMTDFYHKFNYLSFTPYIEWKEIKPDVFMATPKIKVWYGKDSLKYFHIPKYSEVKIDFYLLTNSNNKIQNEKIRIIPGKLEGFYMISLDTEEKNIEVEIGHI